ncbi:NADP-specific glutamate dehydrogenase [Phellopilus nigrolimitatus]|nr:NADP-specific glutamate dehydrogenase [Phellopilus nigrolimitatus]
MVLPSEPEFEQALNELTSSLQPFLKANPEYQRALDVVQVPERLVQFRVVWEDDQGRPHVNRGYRVQYNSALGPYKGGLRLHPSVNLSILKFLGLEQTFKNALTGLSMGGAKGGADFEPKGRSDAEVRRFCAAFMAELARHIGADTDVPAGDIGTGAREVGFLFGAYKRVRNEWTGVLTGKGADWGGSHIRPEATGYGLIYYVLHVRPHPPSLILRIETLTDARAHARTPQMIEKACPEHALTLPATRVAISGSGNVAQYAALKALALGATVLSLSDSRGALLSTRPRGFAREDVERVAALKLRGGALEALAQDSEGDVAWTYHAGARPWTLVGPVHVALPCATQNEVSGAEAAALVEAGVRIVAEGSNMGCTQEAIEIFEASRARGGAHAVWYAPGKAANCGGVAVSGLEMAQNSQRLTWAPAEVDARLREIMTECYNVRLPPSFPLSLSPSLSLSLSPSLLRVRRTLNHARHDRYATPRARSGRRLRARRARRACSRASSRARTSPGSSRSRTRCARTATGGERALCLQRFGVRGGAALGVGAVHGALSFRCADGRRQPGRLYMHVY